MSPRARGWALARPVLAVAAAAGLVAAAAQSSGAVVLGDGPAGPGSGSATATAVAVRESLAVCPGPETEGLPSVPGVAELATTVAAASAPAAVLGALGTTGPAAGAPGAVRLLRRPTGGEIGGMTARGGSVGGSVTGATLVEVIGTETLAPAVAALQTSLLRGDSDDRGLGMLSCTAPAPDLWLLGGGGDATRRERLVVTNPGANTLTVDVEVYGQTGKLASAGAGRLVVPPHGRVSLLLDALAAGEPTPAVHVVATGGVVAAVLEDAWIEGAVGRGRDDSAPVAPPALEQVVPATLLAGPARLRLLVPGSEEAVVLARLLTADGPMALPGGGVTRVKGGTVVDVDLGALAPGEYAVQVRSDRPVVAAVMLERRAATPDAASDLAWVAATPALTGPAALTGTPVPANASARLVLTGTGERWRATVWLVAADGTVASQEVAGEADSTVALDVAKSAAVWVHPTTGTVHAGLGVAMVDPAGPLFAVAGLGPVPVLTTPVPVREVRR